MKLTGHVDISNFRAAMKALPSDIRKEVRRALKEAADIIVARAKELCPVDTGAMKASIRSRQAQYNRGRVMNDMMYEIHVGVPYASFVELGTSRQRAQPFLRPAIREKKQEVINYVHRAVRSAILQRNLRYIEIGL